MTESWTTCSNPASSVSVIRTRSCTSFVLWKSAVFGIKKLGKIFAGFPITASLKSPALSTVVSDDIDDSDESEETVEFNDDEDDKDSEDSDDTEDAEESADDKDSVVLTTLLLSDEEIFSDDADDSDDALMSDVAELSDVTLLALKSDDTCDASLL